MKPVLVFGACALAVLAGVIGLMPGDPSAGAAFSIIWAFALGFVAPRRAWLWPLLLGAWLPLGAITRWLPDYPGGWADCTHSIGSAWQIALAVFAGIVFFTAAGALTAVALNAVLNQPALRDVGWSRFVKPVLDWGGSALAIGLVLYGALAVAQPLHPYAPGERYCWDEFCFRVDSIKRVKTLGSGAQRVVAQGTFYVVSATLESPWWGRMAWGPDSVYVVTYDGSQFARSVAGQRVIDASQHRSSACHQIKGASESETIVFDLPDDAVQPRLLMRDTLGVEGLMGATRLGRSYVKPGFNLRYD